MIIEAHGLFCSPCEWITYCIYLVNELDGADGAFNPDEIQGPPAMPPSWSLVDKVVCSQPARNLSRPDGLEDPDEDNQVCLSLFPFILFVL